MPHGRRRSEEVRETQLSSIASRLRNADLGAAASRIGRSACAMLDPVAPEPLNLGILEMSVQLALVQ
jgi:hypothetical protein